MDWTEVKWWASQHGYDFYPGPIGKSSFQKNGRKFTTKQMFAIASAGHEDERYAEDSNAFKEMVKFAENKEWKWNAISKLFEQKQKSAPPLAIRIDSMIKMMDVENSNSMPPPPKAPRDDGYI